MNLWEIWASIGGLGAFWLMGNRNKWGPLVGLLGQVGWFGFCITGEHWVMLISVVPYTLVHARNSWKWLREAR